MVQIGEGPPLCEPDGYLVKAFCHRLLATALGEDMCGSEVMQPYSLLLGTFILAGNLRFAILGTQSFPNQKTGFTPFTPALISCL